VWGKSRGGRSRGPGGGAAAGKEGRGRGREVGERRGGVGGEEIRLRDKGKGRRIWAAEWVMGSVREKTHEMDGSHSKEQKYGGPYTSLYQNFLSDLDQ
jgi:hypothetical protein